MLAVKHKSVCDLLAGSCCGVYAFFHGHSGFFWGFINIRERRWPPAKNAA